MSEPNKDGERGANATEDWDECMAKMSTDGKYQYMLEHDILTDCTFVVGPEDGETREFKAHRVQVARASAVFEAMLLRGEMVEAKTGHVRVTDLSPNTFQLLLSSIYGKKVEMTNFQEAEDLAFAADKYQMKALLENCVSRMCALITSENIWTALDTAELLQEARLKEKCVQGLQHDTLRCITNAGFMQASEENVALLLEQDELNVEDEVVLVNMIVHWARYAARQRGLSDDDEGVRAVLEPRLLPLLRFLSLTYQQFVVGPGLAGWLSCDEKAAISKCLRSGDLRNLPQNLSSVTQKRRLVTRETSSAIQTHFICKREIVLGSARKMLLLSKNYCFYWYKDRAGDGEYRTCVHAMLIFRVKSSCQWLGFQCASQCNVDPNLLEAKYPVYHEVIDVSTYAFSHTLSTNFYGQEISQKSYEQDTEFNSSTTIMFNKPIPLDTDNWFAVEVKLHQKYVRGRVVQYSIPSRARSVVTAGVEFIFHTEKREGYHNSLNDGIFESLIFSR